MSARRERTRQSSRITAQAPDASSHPYTPSSRARGEPGSPETGGPSIDSVLSGGRRLHQTSNQDQVSLARGGRSRRWNEPVTISLAGLASSRTTHPLSCGSVTRGSRSLRPPHDRVLRVSRSRVLVWGRDPEPTEAVPIHLECERALGRSRRWPRVRSSRSSRRPPQGHHRAAHGRHTADHRGCGPRAPFGPPNRTGEKDVVSIGLEHLPVSPNPAPASHLPPADNRSIQLRSESGSRRCVATLTASGPKRASTTPACVGVKVEPSRSRHAPRLSIASVNGRSSDRRSPGSRPCRSLPRRRALASPARRTAGCRPSGSLLIAVQHRGRRRRSPRPNSCMSASGPNASKTSCRSSSESLSRVSSSWLRTKFAYWQSSDIAMVSLSARAIGPASCRASESQIACIRGKLNSSWTSSASLPTEEVDELLRPRLTSPRSIPSPRRREMNERRCFRIWCGSRSMSSIWLVSIRNGTASTRNPSTPNSNQNPAILAISSRTVGCRC